MERLFELSAVFDDPPAHGGVIQLHLTFLHEFFDMTGAQGIRHLPADTHENDFFRKMRPFKTDRHRRPLMMHWWSCRAIIPQMASNENLRHNQ